MSEQPQIGQPMGQKIQHRTSCKTCRLDWTNVDNRDYSKDLCPQCGKPVTHTIEKLTLVRPKRGILPKIMYATEPPESFE